MPRFRDEEGVWLQRFKDDFSGKRERGEMTDVTLVCKDGSLLAHSLILAGISQQLRKILATLLEREDDGGVISVILPDVTVAEVETFLGCLYGEKLPGKKPEEIKAVKDVFSLISGVKVSQDFMEPEKPEKCVLPNEIVSESKERDARPNVLDEDHRSESQEVEDGPDTRGDQSQMKENIEETKKCSNKSDEAAEDRRNIEEEKKKGGGGGEVIASRYLGRQERAERLAAKLESLCEFCRNPVASHRVTIMVKEKVCFIISSFIQVFTLIILILILKVTSKLVCCMCGAILSNPASFVKHHKAEVKQRTGRPLPELWSFFCPICRLPLAEHRMQCCHCQENFPTHGALTLHLKTLQVVFSTLHDKAEK